jgi:hypothetical protein
VTAMPTGHDATTRPGLLAVVTVLTLGAAPYVATPSSANRVAQTTLADCCPCLLWASLTAPMGAQRVLLQRESGLYTVDLSTSQEQAIFEWPGGPRPVITGGDLSAPSVTVAPDGRQVAVLLPAQWEWSVAEGNRKVADGTLLIIDATGKVLSQRPLDWAQLQCWGPDARAVYGYAEGGAVGRGVFRIDLGTGRVACLTPVGRVVGISPRGGLAVIGHEVLGPDNDSRDDDQIAVAAIDLSTMRTTGRAVVSEIAAKMDLGPPARFSPDGAVVAMPCHWTHAVVYEFLRVQADGHLTAIKGDAIGLPSEAAWPLAWTSDGTLYYALDNAHYAQMDDISPSLAAMRAGGGRAEITAPGALGHAFVEDLIPSPDGQLLAISLLAGDAPEVWVVGADSQGLRRLAEHAHAVGWVIR